MPHGEVDPPSVRGSERDKLTRWRKGLTLTTAALAPFTANSIVKAELVIRAADWHPVAQRFEVQGENGVRTMI
jgi:hypothetical protein